MYSNKRRRSVAEIEATNDYERDSSLAAFLIGIAHTRSQVDELIRLTEWGYMRFMERYMTVSEYGSYESAIAARDTLVNYYLTNGLTVLAAEAQALEIPVDTTTKRDVLAAWKEHLELQLQDNFSKTQIKQILEVSKQFLVGKTLSQK